jgi:hypothetical protein
LRKTACHISIRILKQLEIIILCGYLWIDKTGRYIATNKRNFYFVILTWKTVFLYSFWRLFQGHIFFLNRQSLANNQLLSGTAGMSQTAISTKCTIQLFITAFTSSPCMVKIKIEFHFKSPIGSEGIWFWWAVHRNLSVKILANA